MDPALTEAAINGDVEFIKEAFSKQPSEYFLTQTPKREDDTVAGNIFHLAAWKDKVEFIKEAVKILPLDIQKQLLFQRDDFTWTPFHAAAGKTPMISNELVMVFRQIYASLSSLSCDCSLVKPWLAVTDKNMTPLHLAMENSSNKEENEKCAMEMLSMDSEYESCTVVDTHGNTPLVYALKYGFNLVAHYILMSPLSASSLFHCTAVLTPFTYATNCSDIVVKLLFQKYGEWLDKTDDKGLTILLAWANDGEARPCKLLLEGGSDLSEVRTKVFKEMVFGIEKEELQTPVHIAAEKKDSELAQILIRGYQQQLMLMSTTTTTTGNGGSELECPVWRVKNIYGNTPLHVALYPQEKHFEFALEILSIDPTLCKIRNNRGESPFFLAVWSGCARVIDAIMEIEEPCFQMLRSNDGTTILHRLSLCSETSGRRLLEKYWWMISLRDDSGKTTLDIAKEENTLWLINLLTDTSIIRKERFDWIGAYNREETAAVLAFIDNCHDLQKECRYENDTPLHHIKLSTYEEYIKFFRTPSIAELKNSTDYNGATPLHRALERKDMLLAKVLLLDNDVERTIPDRDGRTSMTLLAKLCKENGEWERMCKLIKVNPYLKTSYIQPGTNLDQIRNTLSVVAALLATITFAAGFTLPGGLDSNSGEALLARQAGFLIFLVADVYAMCTSMLVLFCLIWSMVSEPDMVRLLVDRSVFILMQSLYGTLVAFVAGIYTVIRHDSLWAAIVIFVMCSIIGISANRTILHKVIVKLVPAAANKDKHDNEMRLLEEGYACTSSMEMNGSTIREGTSTP